MLDHALTRYQELAQQAAVAADQARAQAQRQLAVVRRKIASLLRAVEDGMYHCSMKERLSALEKAKADLEATTKATNGLSAVDTISTPSFAGRYRAAIDALAETLNDPAYVRAPPRFCGPSSIARCSRRAMMERSKASSRAN